MDLIPKPDQVVSAATNVARKVLHGGLADLRPMPRTLVDQGALRAVHHYEPRSATSEHGDPVLLVAPLAAPATAFDLRRGCSLVEHLVDAGHPTYVVEYGDVPFAHRGLGLAHWVDEVVPRAVQAVSRHAGHRPVHVVGWSLGSVFALVTAADRPDLPLASLTTLGAAVDLAEVPLVAPFRPFLGITGERAGLLSHAYRLLGGLPAPLVGGRSSWAPSTSWWPSRWRWPPSSTTPTSWPSSRPSSGSARPWWTTRAGPTGSCTTGCSPATSSRPAPSPSDEPGGVAGPHRSAARLRGR